MRRLPIYFLLDISESMVGDPIEHVQDGMATIIKELKADPFALETVWLSIIGFAGKSKVITPLQDIITFYPPKIPIGGGTSLASGLNELMNAIDREVATLIEASVVAAQASPEPSAADMLADVYVKY